MDKARVISIFTGVVRAGSFSRAAVAAGMAPQAVSKAIRQLEEHLGVRLFHRTTRSLALTDEGQRLFDLAHPGLRLLEEALDQVQGSRAEVEGLIRLAAPMSLGQHLLAPLLREFRQRHPRATFDLLLDDHYTDLVAARIDVGFRIGNPPERNLIARPIGQVTLRICAAPRYLEQYGSPASLADLGQHRCTGFRQPNTGRLVPWEVPGPEGTTYLDVPCVASFNTAESEVAAVREGVGIGQLAGFMVRDEIAGGRLVHLLPELDSRSAGIHMYYQQRTQLPARVRHFIDYAVDAAGAHLSGA
jgi:DNA-binding transcriptional LysR family regulator